MLNRIGDLAHNTRLQSYTQSTQTRLRETQVAVSTGKSAQSFTEISDDAALLVATRHERALTEAHITQNRNGIDRLRAMDGALGNITEIVERARSLVVQRLSGPLGEELPLDIEIDTMMREIAGQANIKLDNRFLFAGSRTDTQPLELPATVTSSADLVDAYRGDEVTLTIRADETIEIDMGITGAELLPVLETLADLKAAHTAGDVDAIQAGLDLLEADIGDMANAHGTIGAKMARLESVTDGLSGGLDYLNEIISRIEDTDLPEAMTLLARDRTTLEAAYVTITQISRLSLADYIR